MHVLIRFCSFVIFLELPLIDSLVFDQVEEDRSVAYQPPSLGVVLQGGGGSGVLPGNFFHLR